MPNHLANETSPYLRQHVNNPVDWYPWSDEALALSRRHDRPIFLSIGYSACHWCHVMEHECFENHEIAGLMNQFFVCIKVDREERPDLDQIYMNAVQAMTGSGGWPMSVFLTPDLRPFFGGTYWPPIARWGRPGFREVLAGVHDAWLQRREAVDTQAEELTQHLQQTSAPSTPRSPLGLETLQRAMRSIIHAADPVHGGFGSAPKFPHPLDLRLGLRLWKRFGDVPESKIATKELFDVVMLTLDEMARGGIYDQLGGGFARYSTDERWLVPHFEKMLYDNAQLVPAYLEAYQITGRSDFAQVARETLDYVLREMTQPQGGFFSTQDADSEGVEGKFFVWSESEVDAVLRENFDAFVQRRQAEENRPTVTVDQFLLLFKQTYDVTAQGNWEHKNILNRSENKPDSATMPLRDPVDCERILAYGRQKLFEVRSQRVWPGRDEKVLVSWNGLMIAAMAMGASVLNEPRYATAACAAADFILQEMIEPCSVECGSTVASSRRLLHCYQDGRPRFNAYLDDYAALIDGLCELYQAVFDVKYLTAAVSLAEEMLEKFWDRNSGGFFYTSADHEKLIARIKETHDNATPSGNSLAVTGLLKLARLTGRTDLEEKAVATLEMMSGQLERIPLAAGLSLMALDFLLGPTHEIVIAPGNLISTALDCGFNEAHFAAQCEPIVTLYRRFVPNKVVHRRDAAISDEQLPAATRSILSGKNSQQDQTTAYFCEQGVCGPAVVGDSAIQAALERL